MKSLLICFLLFSCYFVNYINCDSILWNVASNAEYSFNDILSKSDQHPVVIFMHPNFDISQFSRQANVYGLKNDGGRLKNLKKWIDRSEGYIVKQESLTSQLLQYFDTTEYNPDSPTIDDDVSVMLVKVVDWDDLDSKAEEMRRIFKGKKYVAILTTVAQYRKKRAADTTTDTPQNVNATYVEVGDCKLYAEGIYFLAQLNSSNSTNSLCQVTLYPLNPDPDTSVECGNFTGTIELSYKEADGTFTYSGNCGGDNKKTLSTLNIRMIFDIDNTTDTWFVSEVNIDATGTLIPNGNGLTNEIIYENKNRTWNFDYISGSQYFSYACSAPPPISSAAITEGQAKSPVIYKLAFKNLQVQPFAALHPTTNSRMTDNVDDCVPFFNIYIWMVLIAMLLLVSIILCGMGMMASLRTMDRFEDVRAKTITVNVVN